MFSPEDKDIQEHYTKNTVFGLMELIVFEENQHQTIIYKMNYSWNECYNEVEDNRKIGGVSAICLGRLALLLC